MILKRQLISVKELVIVCIMVLNLLIKIQSKFDINSSYSFWHVVCHVLFVVFKLDQKLFKNTKEIFQRENIVVVLESHLHTDQIVLADKQTYV